MKSLPFACKEQIYYYSRFAKEGGLYCETVCTWGQTLHTVMKEALHWEVMPGPCFSLHLALCHSICSHLAPHQTQMKTSKPSLKSEVIVFLKKCHCWFIHLLCLIGSCSQGARRENPDGVKLHLDKNAVYKLIIFNEQIKYKTNFESKSTDAILLCGYWIVDFNSWLVVWC